MSKNAIPIFNLEKWIAHKKLLDRLVVIDSTWSQSHSIFNHERLRSLPKVQIETQKTLFWRGQTKTDDCLATIEV